MSKVINKQRYNSLIFKLIVGTFLIIFPLVFFLIFDNYYAIKTLHSKISESNSNTIGLYMNQIDSDLRAIDSYMLDIATFDTDVNNLNNTDDDSRVLSKIRLQNDITKAMSKYKTVDGFFIYSKASKDYFDAYSIRSDYSESQAISGYISKISDNDTNYNKMGWLPTYIDSSSYILRIFYVDNVYVGAWINVKTLMPPLLKINLQREGSVLFADSYGTPLINSDFIKNNNIDLSGDLSHYYFSGKGKSQMVIGKRSEVGKFSLIAVTSEENLLQGLDLIQMITGIIALLSIIAIPVTLLVLRKWIFKPITKLKHAINRVEEGDLEYRIENYDYSNEFMSVNKSFNKMVSQIKQLKIDVYEEQINEQKSKLEYLEMQIKPHFYLNALNNIYSMAQTKDFQLIQSMVLYLSDYLRYLFRNNFTLVPLESEITHVRNYLQIQKIHSGESMICNIDADQSLINMQLPPLILQTFTENVVKHASNPSEPINIFIKVTSIENDIDKYAIIRIQDNGNGFSEEALQLINSDLNNRHNGEHIGIWNVKQRLRLIYGDRASITASNIQNSGACIEIKLPVETEVIQR